MDAVHDDMYVLSTAATLCAHRFWCYFLRDNMNDTMLEDFVRLAWEDAEHNYNYGIECLFRFYSYGLEKKFDAPMYKEFERMTLRVRLGVGVGGSA